MKHSTIRKPNAGPASDHAHLDHALRSLVQAEVNRTLATDIFGTMLSGGIAGLASLANAKAVAEGRLLEKAIALIAASNPSLKILTQVRLPIREAAMELVENNDVALYSGLVLDANERTRKSYTADLIIVDVDRQIAYIVDIKRSLGSFESARIVELRQRMLAAALVAADLLWRDHKRLAVRDVRIVIIEAAGKRTDVDNGVWALDHLDHLLGVEGAADMVRTVRQDFARLAEANLEDALKQLARGFATLDAHSVNGSAPLHVPAGQGRRGERDTHSAPLDADSEPVRRRARRDDRADQIGRSEQALRIGIAPPPPVH